ncbi:MAG: GcrA family cell cycle regulator [Brevundimonas sp.]
MSVWTKDRVDRLKTLWREGRTAAAIARELGDDVSRCAVLGKVYRLGLSAARTSPAGAATAAGAAPRSPGPHPSRRRSAPRAASRPAAEGTGALPVVGSRTVLTVRRGDCRWPIGDPGDHAFSLCGAAVSRGAYCAGHAAIAYRGAPVRAESLLAPAGGL